MKLVTHEVTIAAPAEAVFRLLTESEGLLRWIGIRAFAEPVPGGKITWTHQNGDTVIGRFLELDPPRRVVFTYGWADGQLGLPPEASVVEIDLQEHGGETTIRLVHRGIPAPFAEPHLKGWAYFFARLADVAGDAAT